MSTTSAKHLEKTLAIAAIAALSPIRARLFAAWMIAHGPEFVLMGATPSEVLEWKSAARWLRVVVGGEPE